MAKSQPWQWIPTNLSLAQFEQFVWPHLSQGSRGPARKLSAHAIFNYILRLLLYLGCQWKELPIEKDRHGRASIARFGAGQRVAGPQVRRVVYEADRKRWPPFPVPAERLRTCRGLTSSSRGAIAHAPESASGGHCREISRSGFRIRSLRRVAPRAERRTFG
jgi:hypothetical protein